MGHIHEKIDFTSETFIVFQNKVLLRFHDKHKFWCSVGGHIELDEDPNEAAIREVKEEVGLDVKIWNGTQRFTEDPADVGGFRELIPPVALNRHSVTSQHEHVTFVYFASSSANEVIPEQPTDEWKWCSREDLDTMDLRPNIKYYAIEALNTLAS